MTRDSSFMSQTACVMAQEEEDRMKTTTKKKFALNREMIRGLTGLQLRHAHGGAPALSNGGIECSAAQSLCCPADCTWMHSGCWPDPPER